MFSAAAIAGLAARADATSPCTTVEFLTLSIVSATVDGQPVTVPVEGHYYLFENDTEHDGFVAGVFDPDTGAGRTVELRRAP